MAARTTSLSCHLGYTAEGDPSKVIESLPNVPEWKQLTSFLQAMSQRATSTVKESLLLGWRVEICSNSCLINHVLRRQESIMQAYKTCELPIV